MSRNTLSPTYTSGEKIEPGDRVLYHGERGRVEFVAIPEDPEMKWYAEQYGNGCMILAPSFGRVFVTECCQDEDLRFLSRADPLHKRLTV
jgi:hypothetical protein